MPDNVGMGEHEMLARLRERLPPAPPRLRLASGDDAAVTVPGGATATSTDTVVDGIHFRREWSTSQQIGHKALATALSDLAAMGAEPGEAYIALGLPEDMNEAGFMALLDGALALAESTGTALAGGDVVRSPVLTLTVTVVGHADRAEDFVSRGGAQPGDHLVVTGRLGGAAAGLLLLEGRADTARAHLSESLIEGLIARQLEPQPQIGAGRALAHAGARAMIDLSDGLGADAGHMSTASGHKLEIDIDRLPLAAGIHRVAAAAGMDLELLATASGEDYELLAALPPERVPEAMSAVAEAGVQLTEIGVVSAGQGVELRLTTGELLKPTGFDQLQ